MHDDRDDQVQALFRRIDDGPPLDIDVQDLMTRGKRIRARRTALAVVGSTLAVAGTVAVSLSLATGSRSPDLVPADPPSVTSELPAPPSGGPSQTTGVPLPNGSAPSGNTPPTGNDLPGPDNGNGNGNGEGTGEGTGEGDASVPLPADTPPGNGPGGGP
jgi:hypothetical protein